MKQTLLLGLVLLTLLVYAPVRHAGFVYEDAVYVDPAQRAITQGEVLAPRGLTALSFRANARLAGQDPRSYHAVNVFVHVLVGLMVYQLAALLLPPGYALLTCALFLLHPLQTEAVAYVAGRAELISALGAVTAVWAMAQPTVTWAHVGLALVALVVAIGGKELGIVAIPLIGLYTALVRKPSRSWRLWGAAGAALGVAAVFLVPILRSRILGNTYLDHSERGWLGYAALQSTAAWTMLRLSLLPVGQTVDHDIETVTKIGSLGALAVGIALLVWAWRQRHRWPVVAFGIAWLFVCLAPRFVVRITEYINEHQFYLPMVGICLALSAGVMHVNAWLIHRANPHTSEWPPARYRSTKEPSCDEPVSVPISVPSVPYS